MFGVTAIVEVREKAAAYAAGFDPALLSAADAEAVAAEATRASHMLATVAALAAKRAAEGGRWRQLGHPSPAHHLAKLSGSGLGKAKEALGTAAALGRLAELDAAARKGEVSPAQAAAIAGAATADPSAERRLLNTAQRASLGELCDECDRTKASAQPDAEARHRAIHEGRFLRKRRCADGAAELHYRSTAEEVAEIFAAALGYANQAFHQARREGRREPEEAYLADGLLAAARVAAWAASEDQGAGHQGRDEQAEDEDEDLDGEKERVAPAPPAASGSAGRAGPGPSSGPAPSSGDEPAGGPAGEARVPAPGTEGEGAAPGKKQLQLYRLLEELGEVPPGTAAAFSRRSSGGAPAGPAPPPARPETNGRGSPRPRAGPAPSGRDKPRAVPAKILVRIDWDALLRGYPVGGEVCEIAGVGPVAVSAVEAMIASGDAFLAAVVTKGADVVNVAHLGRRPSAAQRSALEWRHPACAVEGCNHCRRLEADHRVPWAEDKVTLVSNMDGLCQFHHDLKTYRGWALVDGVGKRPMVPPDDPRHPANGRTARAGAVR